MAGFGGYTAEAMSTIDQSQFERLCEHGNVIALHRQITSDQLTPVLAYRRLVAPDDRLAPSFLLESVVNGKIIGRHSLIGSRPIVEVLARGNQLTVIDHRAGSKEVSEVENPILSVREITGDWLVADVPPPDAPNFRGGWVGYAGYDTARYSEPGKLPFSAAPLDDRMLPDLHFSLYLDLITFDHVKKIMTLTTHVEIERHSTRAAALEVANAKLDEMELRISTSVQELPGGRLDIDLRQGAGEMMKSNVQRSVFEDSVRRSKEYIAAGDVFQVVVSQRFERRTSADPFDIYRALRVVNPSPYMIYLQAEGTILVASSPELLVQTQDNQVITRPLAGTRPRGKTDEEDLRHEQELLGDEKERAEHVMLVDLGRNDLGRVSEIASVELDRVLEVERYSHVMHLSSTVRGELRAGLDGWDALASTLPVGTVSGAPKVRAMQIIDELETTRRGPYAGGIGVANFNGEVDMAIALRTMVIPTAERTPEGWMVYIQAGAGLVADSDPKREFEETVAKAAALGRALDLAERAF